MYHIFVITQSPPLLLLPNENLVQILSNDMLYAISVPYSQVLLRSTIQISQNMVKNLAMQNGKTVLHKVINLYIYIYIAYSVTS